MGVAITELLEGREISIEELRGKVLAVDAFNMLYQFLTTIRMPDGTPLRDSTGNVTSHLLGLFSRTTTLLGQGLKLAFVFDGEPPALKRQERERRRHAKNEALLKFKEAEEREDVKEMKKYASRSSSLTREMVAEAKELVEALGLPVIQAPSEGEAQAAYICARGDAFAVVSQDADAFLFGAPRVVKNLNISGKRKTSGALSYDKISPELFLLEENLARLRLTREQLIILAILVGTDYDRGGIKGIGPKKALKLVEELGADPAALFRSVTWDEEYPDLGWRELLAMFKTMPVTDGYSLKWTAPDKERLHHLLVEQHEFSEERLETALKKIAVSDTGQTGLGEFF